MSYSTNTLKRFRVWSIVFFVIPFFLALKVNLYLSALIILGSILASIGYHLSKERKIPRIDRLFAWLLILQNLAIIYVSHFSYPYSYLAFATVPIALFFYYSSFKETYDFRHGWWHVFSVLITVFSVLSLHPTL